MNELLNQLAAEATEYATYRHPTSNIVLSINPSIFEQKFAEMIVKECANFTDPVTRNLMFKHFGIEK